MEMMRSVYPHDQVFGEYCTVNDYIDCPPDELFDYLADTRSLEEWTYSLRGFTPTEEPGCGLPTTSWDRKPKSTRAPSPTRGAHSRLPLRVGSGQTPLDDLPDAGCRRAARARQTGLGRVVDRTAITRSTTATRTRSRTTERPVWVGDFWDMFGAGHLLELKNLKSIAEYRHHHGLPVTPVWMR